MPAFKSTPLSPPTHLLDVSKVTGESGDTWLFTIERTFMTVKKAQVSIFTEGKFDFVRVAGPVQLSGVVHRTPGHVSYEEELLDLIEGGSVEARCIEGPGTYYCMRHRNRKLLYGTTLRLVAGDIGLVKKGSSVFLASGIVRIGDREFTAPSLIDVSSGDREVVALEPSLGVEFRSL